MGTKRKKAGTAAESKKRFARLKAGFPLSRRTEVGGKPKPGRTPRKVPKTSSGLGTVGIKRGSRERLLRDFSDFKTFDRKTGKKGTVPFGRPSRRKK